MHEIQLSLIEQDGAWTLKTNVYDFLTEDEGIISTKTLGMAFEPEQFFENPDGTEIIFNEDHFGGHRGTRTVAGPFAEGKDLILV